jgi:hypothetical protein
LLKKGRLRLIFSYQEMDRVHALGRQAHASDSGKLLKIVNCPRSIFLLTEQTARKKKRGIFIFLSGRRLCEKLGIGRNGEERATA